MDTNTSATTVATVTKIVEGVETLTSTVSQTIKVMEELGTTVMSAFVNGLEKCNSMKYSAIFNDRCIREVEADLKHLSHTIRKFLYAFEYLFIIGTEKKRKEKIEKDLKSKNTDELVAFFEQFQSALDTVRCAHNTAMEQCKKLLNDSNNATENFKIKATQARAGKNVIDSIILIIMLVVFVVSSFGIKLNLLTFDMQKMFVVIFIILVMFLCATGLNALASQFKESEKEFRAMSQRSMEVYKATEEMVDTLGSLDAVLHSIHNDTKNAVRAYKAYKGTTISSLSTAVNILFDRFEKFHSEFEMKKYMTGWKV